MKPYKSIVIAGVVLAVLSLALTVVMPLAAAQVTTGLTGKPLFNVNIRSGPGLINSVIGVLPYGEEIEVIGRTEGNNWVQIKYEETTGWVARWLLIFSDDTYKLPVTTDIEAPLASSAGPFDIIVPFNLNLRGQPSTTGQVLAIIPFNTPLRALGRDAHSSWVKVQYGGNEGWVAAWLIVVKGDINALPVAGATTPSPAATAAPQATVGAQQIPDGAITVTAIYQLNLRAAPSLDADVVAVAPFNATLVAVGRNAGNNWVQVRHGDATGWVAAWIVPISDNPLSLPVTSESTEFAKTWDSKIVGQPFINLTIRGKPGSIYAATGTLPAGTEVELLARTEDSAWIKIKYNNAEGWVVSWMLLASADRNNLPIENPLP